MFVVPAGNVAPELKLAIKLTKPQLSVAEGARQIATAPLIVALVVAKTFVGQPLITGLIASVKQGSTAPETVIVNAQVDELPFESLAV